LPADDSTHWTSHFIRALGASTRHNALAYGYSLALTGAFGMLAAVAHPVRPLDILLFGFGAATTFTLATALTTQGFRRRVREEPAIVRAIGSSFSFISILGALGCVWLVASLIRAWAAWLIGSFLASTVYLLLSAFELAVVRLIRTALPVDDLADPDRAGDSEPE
jgi:MFS family permease